MELTRRLLKARGCDLPTLVSNSSPRPGVSLSFLLPSDPQETFSALQVLKHNGSSEILNKLYDTAMDKLEVVKKDYDALRKRYSEKVAIHTSDLSRLEQLEEENQRLLKQTEMLTQQRDTAIQLQHQCALSLRR